MGTQKIWKYLKCDKEQAAKVSQEFSIDPITAQVVLNRGLTNEKEINEFLNPDIANLSSPFLMKDMKKGCDRVIRAINNTEHIVVCGDYDADGITSTAILVDFLRSCDASVEYYIPDRLEDGYGLSMSVAEKLTEMNPKLVITVDNGITSIDEIKFLHASGIDVVVTDHHECKAELPNAIAVINPHRRDDEYPFKDLAGVGVVYRFIEAISHTIKELNPEACNKDIEKYIELVAIGTVADVMPLLGDNRSIVKHGIQKLNKTENNGIKALIDVSGMSDKDITAWMIGFIIAPRLNAAGRMSSADKAVQLLLTNSPVEAQSIAKALDEENIARQEIEKLILGEVFEKIDQDVNFDNEKIIVVQGDNWHQGVIGIVASKVVDRYGKPCILLSYDGETVKGSARSISNVNIYNAINYCKNCLEGFGGHELAAGVTLKKENVSLLRKLINEYAEHHFTDKQMASQVVIDAQLVSEQLTTQLAEDLEQLTPFGTGNSTPVFCSMGMSINEIKLTSNQKHLKLKLKSGNKVVDAIAFNMPEKIKEFAIGSIVDVAYNLEVNTWRFMNTVQLNIKDLRVCEEVEAVKNYYSSLDYDSFNEYVLNIKNDNLNASSNKLKEIYSSDCSQKANEMLKTDSKKVVFINTRAGLKDALSLYRHINSTDEKSCSICYNGIKNNMQSDICIIVNPKISEIDVTDFKDIIFYKFACSQSFLVSFTEGTEPEQSVFYVGEKNYNDYISELVGEVVPEREDLVLLYRILSNDKCPKTGYSGILSLSNRIWSKFNKRISYGKLENGLGIFRELGLLTVKHDDNFGGQWVIVNNSEKVDISNSTLYQRMQQIKKAASIH